MIKYEDKKWTRQLGILMVSIIVIFIVFLVLKLTSAITLFWIWLLSPLWIIGALIALFWLLAVTGIGSWIVNLIYR